MTVKVPSSTSSTTAFIVLGVTQEELKCDSCSNPHYVAMTPYENADIYTRDEDDTPAPYYMTKNPFNAFNFLSWKKAVSIATILNKTKDKEEWGVGDTFVRFYAMKVETSYKVTKVSDENEF